MSEINSDFNACMFKQDCIARGAELAIQKDKIRQLEQELAEAKAALSEATLSKQSEEDLEIGRQIRRAAGDLPDRYDIKIHVEKGFAGVTLIDDRNKPRDFDFEDNLSDAISEAIDAAIKESK